MNKLNFAVYFQVTSHYFLRAPEEKHMSFRITVLSNTRHDSWFDDDVDHPEKKRLLWQKLANDKIRAQYSSRRKVRPHRTRSAAADCGLCPLRNVTF